MNHGGKTHAELIEGWRPHPRKVVERYIAHGIWPALTTVDLLERNALRVPDRLAFADDKEEVTWREMRQRIDHLADQFAALGVGYADFFVLQLPNVLAFFYVFFALNRLGAIPVLCLPRHRRMEVEPQIQVHQAAGMAVPSDPAYDFARNFKDPYPSLKVFLTTGRVAPNGWFTVDELLRGCVPDSGHVALTESKPMPADICLIGLSGGTTGVPKSIPRTYLDILCQWDWIGRCSGAMDRSVVLVPFPAGHLAASQDLWGPMTLRGGTTIATASTSPEDHFQLIERYGVTHTMLIPAQIGQWRSADYKAHDLSSLRVLMTGGQKLKPALADWAMKELGVHIINVYGMTEGPTVLNRWTDSAEMQRESVGFPLIQPELQVRLVDYNNQPVADGETGEACFKGPPLFGGYFRNPVENAKVFDSEGFFHTGDLLSRRPDGAFVVQGRKKDMIIRAGENVFPEPVEDLLAAHPKVVNAACVGMPDPHVGEKLCAFVQLRGGETFSLDEARDFLRDKGMAVFQWPERVEIVQQWPLTPANKISKRHLRAYIAARLVQEGTIDLALANEYLAKDDLKFEDVLEGRVPIPQVTSHT